MCGLAAQINFDSKPIDIDSLDGMRIMLSHRGPDSHGTFIDGNVGLTHTRLKIIDLSENGNQPMHSYDGSCVIVFNGEIYNYIEIRNELKRRGCHFRSESDTEVILQAYREFGFHCLDYFNGEFSFSIYDKTKKILFCARDRVGIKPFYYYVSNSSFICASEGKVLARHPSVARLVDQETLMTYVNFGFLPGDRSLIDGVKKLLPGHYLIVHLDRKIEDHQYWDIDFMEQEEMDEESCLEALHEKLTNSIKLRLRSDVPIGVFLSGGLDSSTILALLSNSLSGKIKTYSVGFSHGGIYDENNNAEEVSRIFDTDHHSYYMSAQQFSNYFKDFPVMTDEPIIDAPAIALSYLAKEARREITVAFSGEGADEIFAGYPSIVSHQERFFKQLPPFAGQATLKILNILCPHTWNIRMRNVWRAAYFSTLSPKERVFYARVRDKTMNDFVFKGNAKGYNFLDLFNLSSDKTWLDKVLKADFKTYLPERILLKTDRATMANAIESRVPFLDHLVVEYAAKLPSSLKINHRLGSKYLLKKLMENVLPPRVISPKKIGFSVPISLIIKNELKEFFGDILNSKTFRDRGFFYSNRIVSLFDRHVAGKGDYSDILWLVLVLEQWHRSFIDN